MNTHTNISKPGLKNWLTSDTPQSRFQAQCGRAWLGWIKFSENKGNINMSIRLQKKRGKQFVFKVSIKDSGIGISEQDQKSLFQSFHQLDNSSSKNFGGTGLGLAISRELVKSMKGDIGVVSTPGLGSTFWFTFMAEEIPPDQVKASQPDKPFIKEFTGKQPKILLVDDNDVNRKVASSIMLKSGCQVEEAFDGFHAIEKITSENFDLIFMDIQMPQMDGVTACKHIKELENNANTPVIAVTAHAMSGERDRLLAAGMDDYLTKPIEEHVLQQVLIHWSPESEVENVEKIDPEHPAVGVEVESHAIESESSQHKNIIIDWQAAMKQAANKEDLARDMLKMLVDFIPEVYEAADKAIEDSDYPVEQLIHIIHKMHGSSSYSGVPRLKSVCATIEKELRSGTSVEDIEPELFELQDELDKVQATAIHYLKPAKR